MWAGHSQKGPGGIHKAVSTYLPCSLRSRPSWPERRHPLGNLRGGRERPPSPRRGTGMGRCGFSQTPHCPLEVAPVHSQSLWEGIEPAKRSAPGTAETRQTSARPLATAGKPGGCTQPNISVPQHGQLATPLDGLGLRVDTGLTCPPVTVRSSRGVHPPSGGGAASRTDGSPVIAGTSNLVQVQAITA